MSVFRSRGDGIRCNMYLVASRQQIERGLANADVGLDAADEHLSPPDVRNRAEDMLVARAAKTELILSITCFRQSFGDFRDDSAHLFRVLHGRHDRHSQDPRGIDQERGIAENLFLISYAAQERLLHVDHEEDRLFRAEEVWMAVFHAFPRDRRFLYKGERRRIYSLTRRR